MTLSEVHCEGSSDSMGSRAPPTADLCGYGGEVGR